MTDDHDGTRDAATRGHLLISVPDTGDDNFDRTVVLILEHDESGALGVVLNRPSETAIDEHLPFLGVPVASPAVFFVGGPVSIGGLLALGRVGADAPAQDVTPIIGPLVAIDPEALLEERISGIDLMRLYTGYSGWAPGQLDAELAAGAWHVAEAHPDDVLCADPEALWRSVMRRQGGRLRSQSLFPDDVTTN
jgi:putative transcriptional regulator